MAISDGFEPKLFGWIFDELTSVEEFGEVFCDKMKLKADILWSTSNHKAIGFVSSKGTMMDMRDDFEALSKEEEDGSDDEDESESEKEGDKCNDKKKESKNKGKKEEDDFQPVICVNQFCFRAVWNKSRNLGHFLNDGSLSGDELLRQLLHTTLALSLIHHTTLGVLFDAGGNNARLHKLLRGGRNLGSDGWISEFCVKFKNHTDVNKWIASWFCSTHNQKAERNVNNMSLHDGKKGTRSLQNAGGNCF